MISITNTITFCWGLLGLLDMDTVKLLTRHNPTSDTSDTMLYDVVGLSEAMKKLDQEWGAIFDFNKQASDFERRLHSKDDY